VDLILVLVQAALAAGVLAGLLLRGRVHLAWFFSFYLVCIALIDVLFGVWSKRFLTWGFWFASEATQVSLKIGMALELSALILRAFPMARRIARLGLWLILGFTTASIVAAQPTTLTTWIKVALPRAQYGVAYVFAWLLAVVLWFRVPLHPLHKAILMALVPYLLMFTLGAQVLESWEWTVQDEASLFNVIAFIVVLCVWLWAAWRRDEQPDVAPGVVKTVQPWL
jgi:hypothetical protein